MKFLTNRFSFERKLKNHYGSFYHILQLLYLLCDKYKILTLIKSEYTTYQGKKVCVAILQTCAVCLVVLMRHGCIISIILTSKHFSLFLINIINK